MLRILASLVELFSEPPPYRDVLIDLNASELVVRMLRTEAGPLLLRGVPSAAASLAVPDVSDDRLGAAIQFACHNLDHHLTIGDLADRACMSESSFYRHFRNELGMTPLEFLTQERMKRARQLLADRYHTVSEVSHDVGFQSVSYFITTFKEHFGQTPKQYQLSRSQDNR